MDIRVGTDITEVSRISKSVESPRFKERVFSNKEMTLFSNKKNPLQSMAANWAAKEAFSKAIGTGVVGFSLNEVSCLRDKLGAPYLEFAGNALQIVEKSGYSFSVSLSHTKEQALAVVIAFKA